jgi:ATP-dependent phosphoenolpyruvate carboxykinase
LLAGQHGLDRWCLRHWQAYADQGNARIVDSRFDRFAVPTSLEGVDSAILDPRSTWADGVAYDAQAKKLVSMFVTNFTKFEDHVDSKVRDAAPGLKIAAE